MTANLADRASSMLDPDDTNVPVIREGGVSSGGLHFQWVEFSRPGNDPTKKAKENQDSCVVQTGFGHRKDGVFFGVFDGHGPKGGESSRFCASRLPAVLGTAEELEDPFLALTQACLNTNSELHSSDIDVYVSGSTGIMGLLRGNQLCIANVGDSRAVLGRQSKHSGSPTDASQQPQIIALDLSIDQKPDRPDETARINSRGGRVFEWGVPRVWLKDTDMPGLAMSRSFGDIAAETVGVHAEPELSEVALGRNDRLLIFASDGVWEFISSQEAVDIVVAHMKDGPLEGAAALVRESVARWRREEDVVDDITVVLAQITSASSQHASPVGVA